MAEDIREFIGILDDVEYWFNVTKGFAEWRIPDIREAVRAPQGYRILSADYSQVEVKIMAYLSGDPWLIEAINSKKDIHCFMAVSVFGAHRNFDYDTINKARKDERHPRHEELKSLRNQIKSVTFGVSYGAGPKMVAFLTGMSEDEAAALIELYFSHAHVLKAWLENQGRNALTFGFSASPRGRKRFYTLPSQDDREAENKISQIKRWASNQPIQSGNVDMLKPAMAMVYNGLRDMKIKWDDARILFVVHDEIVMICRDKLVSVVAPLLEDSMQKSYLDVVPTLWNEVKVVEADVWDKE